MEIAKNIGSLSGWEGFWFHTSVNLWTKCKTWRATARSKKAPAISPAKIADLLFILQCEIKNLKSLALSEEAKELRLQWRDCTTCLLECRKALGEANHRVAQEKLKEEYVTLKEQYRHLRKRVRAAEAQFHEPIKTSLTKLQALKKQIARAADETYLPLKVEFYLVLAEAKNTLPGTLS